MAEAYLSRRIQAEALKCTHYFNRVSFEDCIPLAIKNPHIPHGPGIYAIKDYTNKILYVGKAVDLWMRLTKARSPTRNFDQWLSSESIESRDRADHAYSDQLFEGDRGQSDLRLGTAV